MFHRALVLTSLLMLPLAAPSFAHDAGHDHGDHEVSAGALTVVHPWARAAKAGEASMVFFEMKNAGDPVQLVGAETELAESVELVGAMPNAEGAMDYQAVGPVTIAPGAFALEPQGLGLRLNGLTSDLVKGEDFELEVEFADGTHVHLHVEVEAADATQHSHAGHSH